MHLEPPALDREFEARAVLGQRNEPQAQTLIQVNVIAWASHTIPTALGAAYEGFDPNHCI
jgi:hypothetical protein